MTIRIGIFSFLLLSSMMVSAGELVDRFKLAHEKSISALTQASVSRDLALNAFKNALAMENDSEDALLAAMRSNNMTNVLVLRKKLVKIKDDTEECLDCCMEVLNLAADGIIAGESAKREYARVIETGTPVKDKSLVKRVESLAEKAECKAKDASEIASCLKKKWLEMSQDSGASSTIVINNPTAGMPPASAPAGNR